LKAKISLNNDKGIRKYLGSLKQPFLATIFGLLIGAAIIVLSGENPVVVYTELFRKSFFQAYYLMQTLTRSTPIIICAIATAAAWRAGYINIGVEGQMIIGSFAATICAIFMPGPPILVLVVSILVGMTAGGSYALIAAYLNLKFKVSLVITTLMMNYIASYLTSYFVSSPLRDRSGDGLASQTVAIQEGIRFLKLSSRTTFNAGFLLAIAVVLIFIFISKETIFGYESRMTGLNPHFARYGGVKQNKNMLATMAMSGAIAALAGIAEIYGVKFRFADGMFTTTSYAWTGLMSALIAGLNPVGMFFSSIFLSGLQVGGQSIQRTSNIPLHLSTVIQACITLFVSAKIFVGFRKKKKTSAAPGNDNAEGGEL
jgi:simple sugar transport system permease protein